MHFRITGVSFLLEHCKSLQTFLLGKRKIKFSSFVSHAVLRCFIFWVFLLLEFIQFIVIPSCLREQRIVCTAFRLKRRAANTLTIASGYQPL